MSLPTYSVSISFGNDGRMSVGLTHTQTREFLGWSTPLHLNQPHPVPELPPLVDSRVEDAADVGRPAAGADERAPIPD